MLKATTRASRALAELKGRTHSIPNPTILLNTLALQEAKLSSEIENIFTTDEPSHAHAHKRPLTKRSRSGSADR